MGAGRTGEIVGRGVTERRRCRLVVRTDTELRRRDRRVVEGDAGTIRDCESRRRQHHTAGWIELKRHHVARSVCGEHRKTRRHDRTHRDDENRGKPGQGATLHLFMVPQFHAVRGEGATAPAASGAHRSGAPSRTPPAGSSPPPRRTTSCSGRTMSRTTSPITHSRTASRRNIDDRYGHIGSPVLGLFWLASTRKFATVSSTSVACHSSSGPHLGNASTARGNSHRQYWGESTLFTRTNPATSRNATWGTRGRRAAATAISNTTVTTNSVAKPTPRLSREGDWPQPGLSSDEPLISRAASHGLPQSAPRIWLNFQKNSRGDNGCCPAQSALGNGKVLPQATITNGRYATAKAATAAATAFAQSTSRAARRHSTPRATRMSSGYSLVATPRPRKMPALTGCRRLHAHMPRPVTATAAKSQLMKPSKTMTGANAKIAASQTRCRPASFAIVHVVTSANIASISTVT